MARQTKEAQWRMEGMNFAYRIARDKGVEGLEKELRLRNLFNYAGFVTSNRVEEIYNNISQNLYINIIATALFTIHDTFGFGKKRLHEFKDAYDKNINGVFDLNWYGEHYVRLEDYAKYLSEKYEFDFDINRIAALQDLQDEQDPRYKKLDPAITLKELREQGFHEAADWLEKKIS